MRDINKLYRDFDLMRQLEAKAAECMEQVAALKKKIEAEFGNNTESTNTNVKISKMTISKTQRNYAPNGPAARTVKLLANTPNKVWSVKEIANELRIPNKNAYEMLSHSVQTQKIVRVGHGKYKAA